MDRETAASTPFDIYSEEVKVNEAISTRHTSIASDGHMKGEEAARLRAGYSKTFDSLEGRRLYIYQDALGLGPHHRKLLGERRDEYEAILESLRADMEITLRAIKTAVLDGSSNTVKLGDKTYLAEDEHYEKVLTDCNNALDTKQKKLQDILDDLQQKCNDEWMKEPRIKSSIGMPEGSNENSKYLASVLGVALNRALVEIIQLRPEDPIEYLALHLKAHAENHEKKRKDAIEQLKIQIEREENIMLQQTIDTHKRDQTVRDLESVRRLEMFMERKKEIEDRLADPDLQSEFSDDVPLDELRSQDGSRVSSSALSHQDRLRYIPSENSISQEEGDIPKSQVALPANESTSRNDSQASAKAISQLEQSRRSNSESPHEQSEKSEAIAASSPQHDSLPGETISPNSSKYE